MKKGERAIFTIPPNLAYGELGSPPLIPPNSTLIFYIEMLSWTTIRDITGDGGILKKITKEGEGWATPREADQVLVANNVKRLAEGASFIKEVYIVVTCGFPWRPFQLAREFTSLSRHDPCHSYKEIIPHGL
ncbi:70 kDa peptidyl-prolyl isomerase-like [Carya illinoinensis]|uniref:peptidylprolyl isomerase n=1 Tax=Carya illinoinensis TaxID=32201 RepID=A0A8T1R217_CARIL|nr:70 kDa peptidyl-prolyl isomerase-like [Carya illinoinensis]KAG6660755.1 hypothetical protein CIPAW_03G126500 [Carya illinoinensis]KAG6721638.1 hypothetical protein I3842_03G121700 [Carya illinoinensis]KAG6721639.1 hypothetical protein I3842_03G121700 [Carya illinoinensis]